MRKPRSKLIRASRFIDDKEGAMSAKVAVHSVIGHSYSGDHWVDMDQIFRSTIALVAAGATLNPAKTGAAGSLSGGNLTFTENTAATWTSSIATVSSNSGLRGFQATIGTNTTPGYVGVGIGNSSADYNSYPGADNNSIGYLSSGQVYLNGALVATFDSFDTGDVITVVTQNSPATFWVRKGSGLWCLDSGADPAAGTGGLNNLSTLGGAGTQLFPMVAAYDHLRSITANLGGSTYSPALPSGATSFGS